MVDPARRWLRRAPSGRWMFFGVPVWGHILPSFELVMFPCGALGETAPGLPCATHERMGVVFGWLGFCLNHALGDVEPLV